MPSPTVRSGLASTARHGKDSLRNSKLPQRPQTCRKFSETCASFLGQTEYVSCKIILLLSFQYQVLAFLQTRSDRADRLRIEHLEQSLNAAKMECNMLGHKLRRKEEEEVTNYFKFHCLTSTELATLKITHKKFQYLGV